MDKPLRTNTLTENLMDCEECQEFPGLLQYRLSSLLQEQCLTPLFLVSTGTGNVTEVDCLGLCRCPARPRDCIDGISYPENYGIDTNPVYMSSVAPLPPPLSHDVLKIKHSNDSGREVFRLSNESNHNNNQRANQNIKIHLGKLF